MTLGAATMACLLLVTGQASDVEYKSNLRNHKIPIEIQPSRQSQIRELLLFVSTDQGKNWQQKDSVPPDRGHFAFYAQTDGVYWFKVAAVNHNNTKDPEDVFKGPPDLKMLIDTSKPDLRILSAQRQGDELIVVWEAKDDHLDVNSVKVEYRAVDANPPIWWSMPITSPMGGQSRARLNTQAGILVRAEARDLVGNNAQVQADVPAAIKLANNVQQDALPGALPGNPGPPVLPPGPTPVPPPVNLAPAGSVPPIPQEMQQPLPKRVVAPPPPSVQPDKIVAQSESHLGPNHVGVTQTSLAAKAPRLQIVNDKEITLQYRLDKVGPSGVGRIEVWLTRDGGKSWKLYADSEEEAVPYNNSKGLYKKCLELPGEGVFGLCLVVKSKVGLGRPAPRDGDTPDMLIEVDLTKPSAQMFSPQLDPERKDSVVLTWAARDRNLSETPITLEWATHDAGPWQPIAVDLPNSGRYSWPVGSNVPAQVYLRLRVRDQAGNEGVAVTNQPQTVDLSIPVGEFIGVETTGRNRR